MCPFLFQIIFSTSLPLKYELYPGGQLSVARNDAHQYIANVSIPLSTTVRQEIENFLTSFNRRLSKKKKVTSTETMFVSFRIFRIWSCQNSLFRIIECLSNTFLSCRMYSISMFSMESIEFFYSIFQ